MSQTTTLEKENKDLKKKLAVAEKAIETANRKELKESLSTDPMEGYSGEYKEIKTGAIFALKIMDDALVRHHKTHCVRNKTHYGEYTALEFRALFDKL